jgi:hypothetical protein
MNTRGQYWCSILTAAILCGLLTVMGLRLADMVSLQTRRAQEEVRRRRWVDEFAIERRRHYVAIAQPAPSTAVPQPTDSASAGGTGRGGASNHTR